MAKLLTCQAPDCGVEFEARAGTKFHTATCRSRARRAREAAAANASDEAKTDTPAEHGLVKAVRRELEQARAMDTVAGQLAMQFARQLVNPEASSLTAMSKELRALLEEAKAGAAPTPDPGGTPPADDDEVTRARRKREEIEAAAAAEAKA